MRCPYCGSTDVRVLDKRDNLQEGTIRRRRQCGECSNRFTTYERSENVDLNVAKRNGLVEAFNREKLEKGISKAVKRDELSSEEIKQVVDDVEMDLLNKKESVVSSKEIGELVLKRFRKINPVVYMRFASVYKNFSSLKDFKDEIKNLEN